MFATAFSEAEIHVTGWMHVLRDKPSNVTIVGPERWVEEQYDALVDDCGCPLASSVQAKRRISVVHIEQNLGDPNCRRAIEKVYDSNDYVVAVSERKKFTLREFSDRKETKVALFVAPDFEPSDLRSGVIGCVQNAMCEEKMAVWNAVSSNPDCVAIGFGNSVKFGESVFPQSQTEYMAALKRLSVFVNVVVGDSFGMASVEAMAMGIPMVTGFSLDIPKNFISGWNCLMTNSRGNVLAQQIASFAVELRNNEGLRKSIGEAGRKTVRSLFTKSAFRSAFLEVLR
jgi:hypothetical protein